jgi:hypothetical protein
MPKVDMSKTEMAKQTVVAIATMLAISGAIVECRAASGLRLTCSGNLTNTREDGITLGQCDLNSLPVKDIGSIEDICEYPALSIRRLKRSAGLRRPFRRKRAAAQIIASSIACLTS